MCVERTLTVTVDGKEFEATAFVTSPQRARVDGEVSGRYVEALISGAKQAGLPADYIASLRTRGL